LLVLVIFLVIILVLGGGLFLLLRNTPNSKTLGAAFTLLTGLAVLLFLMLIGAWMMGLIQPHGIAG